MTAFFRHLRALWPGWTILAPLPFAVHAVWAAARHEFHWENAAALAIVAALFCTGPRTKKLFVGAYPIGLVGISYSSMRAFESLGLSPGRIHDCDLRAVEVALFGVTVNGVRGTLHDWFQIHWEPWLDLLCAIPYATFLYVCFALAVWLYFRDYRRMLRFGWCFFALNIAGFVTYHVYPAAPPWYYHLHGCHVDLSAAAYEGPNLARVDAMIGVRYFHGMYGRAADVFGAMPSLHVATALIVVLEGWPLFGVALRIAGVIFYLAMLFSAVYLDHHWVLDALAGSLYCVVTVACGRWLTRPRVPSAP